MAQISITDLTIGFRGPSLLDGVTCQIEAGQKIGLLGRNGAGKTTLMRLISGDLEP
ncbi:MAG: ATP-binding cassette domain-containing protein, partial [Planctomycetales bacterium]|nr:ATP-binding cassette domain-containing protein [Planctomycetales bacterium]